MATLEGLSTILADAARANEETTEARYQAHETLCRLAERIREAFRPFPWARTFRREFFRDAEAAVIDLRYPWNHALPGVEVVAARRNDRILSIDDDKITMASGAAYSRHAALENFLVVPKCRALAALHPNFFCSMQETLLDKASDIYSFGITRAAYVKAIAAAAGLDVEIKRRAQEILDADHDLAARCAPAIALMHAHDWTWRYSDIFQPRSAEQEDRIQNALGKLTEDEAAVAFVAGAGADCSSLSHLAIAARRRLPLAA